MDPNNSVIKRLWCILVYARKKEYAKLDDCRCCYSEMDLNARIYTNVDEWMNK